MVCHKSFVRGRAKACRVAPIDFCCDTFVDKVSVWRQLSQDEDQCIQRRFSEQIKMDYANRRKMDIERKILDKLKQRIAIQFAVNLGENPVDISAMIQRAYGATAMSERTCRRWIRHFQNNRNHCITDAPRQGCPCTARTPARTAQARQVIQNDRTVTLHNLAQNLGTDRMTAQRVVTKDL